MTDRRSFVERAGDQLRLNGGPFRMVGANIYYFAFSDADDQARLLDLACHAGFNVLRVWAFNDFKPQRDRALPSGTDLCFQFLRRGSDRPEPRDGPFGLERLDRAVKLAGERGIRLILTLTNYWPDYGGMPQYQEWLGLADLNDFYRDARAKSTFQNWVRALITRRNPLTGLSFAEDPTILAWEIANEPRSTGKTGRTTLLTAWLREMSQFVRTYAPNQLIAAGDEGFFANRAVGRGWLYDGSTGVDTESILAIPEIDIGTYHLYPDVYAPKHDPETFGRRWIKAHLDVGLRAAKPVVLAEYGLPDCPGRNHIYGAWLHQIEAAHGGGDLVWMLGLAGMGDRFLLTSHREAPAIREHAARFATPQLST